MKRPLAEALAIAGALYGVACGAPARTAEAPAAAVASASAPAPASAPAVAPAAALSRQEILAAAEKLRSDPNLGGEKKIRTLHWIESKTQRQPPADVPAWIAGLFQFLGQSGSVLLWIAGAFAAAVAVVWSIRTFSTRLPAGGDRFVKLQLSFERDAKSIAGFGVFGPQRNGAAMSGDGLVQFVFIRQRDAEIVMGLGQVRAERNRLPVRRERFFQLALIF